MTRQTQMFTPLLVSAVLSLSCTTAAHADTLAFSAVRNSSLPLLEYQSGTYTYTQSQFRSDSTISSVAIPTGLARSQTLHGTNRVGVDNFVPVDDEFLRANSFGGPFAVAISAWVDRFTITGGVGLGTAQVSASITGQFGPKPGPSYGASGEYYLFVAEPNQIASLFAKPLEFMFQTDLSDSDLRLFQGVPTPGFSEEGMEILAPGSQFGRVLTGTIEFEYDRPFYLVSILAGISADYGILNSFESANFGISALPNASILTESGFTYASAVPEPGVWLLFTSGVGLILLRHKGIRRFNAAA